MDKGLKILNKSSFQKLTVFASGLALLSACSSQSSSGLEIKETVDKATTSESKEKGSTGNSEKPKVTHKKIRAFMQNAKKQLNVYLQMPRKSMVCVG